MATQLENLTTARDNLAAALATASANPAPNYSKDGQTVSFADYIDSLARQIDTLNGLIAKADPFEIVTEAY